MTLNNVTKLMTFMVMSFTFCNVQTYAKTKLAEKTEEVAEEVQEITSSAARKINQHGIGLGLGQTFLLGNFQDYGDNKITGDMFYTYTASYSFDFLANLHFSNHAFKDKEIYLRGLTFNIKGRSYEFDNFSPYFLGGLGFYQPIIVKDGEESEAKNTFGFSVGAGTDLRLNNHFAVGLLAVFHNPFDIKQEDTEDVRGSYFKLLLTTMYLF
tara:strand:- start:69751 stop:70383 length:633 start_codon:yes stop_codon:yes gene_type:complete